MILNRLKYIIILVLLAIQVSAFAAEHPRWNALPIYVYIPQYGGISQLMMQAFNTWEKTSKGIVRFKFVNNPANSNIEVEFVDFVGNCNDINAVGCTEMMTKGRNYYKSYITIGTKEYIRNFSNGRYQRQLVTRSKNHIYGVMLHEVGHAIGLDHTTNNNSIMYPYDLEIMQYLTDEDIRMLHNKYH